MTNPTPQSPSPSAKSEGADGFTEETISYVARYGGRCRDCADENGVCPGSGLPCADKRKAIRFVLEALTYGVLHGYIENPFATPAEPAQQAGAVPEGWRRQISDALKICMGAISMMKPCAAEECHQEHVEWAESAIRTANEALALLLATSSESAQQPEAQGGAHETLRITGHLKKHLDVYADKHPTLLVRQLACELRDAWALAASQPAGEAAISMEHGPWIESASEIGERYCERCYLLLKFSDSRGCKPHIVYTTPQPQTAVADRAVEAGGMTAEQEREAFEAWAPTQHMRIERWKVNPDLYDDENAISAWQGWEARAALTSKQEETK